MSQENRNAIDQRQLDMLVDGQLSDEARRELLARLDLAPGGWRRCALTFLEAQCWRESLAPVARSAGEPVRAPRPAGSRHRVLHWAAGLALAASVMIAVGLGLRARPVGRPVAPPLEQVAEQADLHGSLPRSASPWRMVTLTSPDSPSEPIRLPAVERKGIDDAWLRSFPSALPADVLRALERTGHAVQQSRELVPVPLEDGRRLVVPVDQVEVHSVGRFQ